MQLDALDLVQRFRGKVPFTAMGAAYHRNVFKVKLVGFAC